MPSDLTLRFELFVDDVPRMCDFLSRILRFEGSHPTPTYVEMRSGNVASALGQVDALPADHPARPADLLARKGACVEIVLETDALDDVYEHVRATGWPIAMQLGARPWGLRDFRIVAPEGFYVRVTSRS